MGKNKKNKRAAKKANASSQRSLLKKQQKEEQRAKLEEARAKERSEYLIIRSDDERPEMKSSKVVRKTVVKTVQESIPAETALESNLKRISLAEIQRYLKTSSEAYDKAYDEMLSYEKELEAIDNEIKSIKTKKGASDEEKLENAKKRKELKEKKSAIEKRIIISKANAEALERSSDEYSHVVALLKNNEVKDLRKKPRLNPKRIDLTKEEEEELVRRYLEAKRPKAKKALDARSVETEEVIEIEEASADVKTLKVLGAKGEKKDSSVHPAETANAIKPNKEKRAAAKAQRPKKRSWLTWALIVIVVIVLALVLKSCHLKNKDTQSEEVKTETVVEAPKPQLIVKEEAITPIEEPEVALAEEAIVVAADSETIDILGYPVIAEFKTDSVSLTIPEAISAADVSAFLSYIAEKYPVLDGSTYEIDGNKVTLNAAAALIASLRPVLKETLEKEISEYIEELSAYSEICNFYGYDITIRAYSNKVEVAYPSIVTEDDVLDFIFYALRDYPELKDCVVYTISRDKTIFELSFTLSAEEKTRVPDLLGEEIISYLALTYGNTIDLSAAISGYKAESSTITIEATVPVHEETKSAIAEELKMPGDNASNSYKTSAAFRASGLYLINKDSIIKAPALYQSYGVSLSFDNILKLGNHTGFGVKADGSVIAVPKNGDYANVNNASSFFNGSNWVGAYSIGLAAVARIELNRIAFYGAFGSGYIYSDSSIDSYMGFGSWYINGEIGAEFSFTDRLYLGIYGEYKNLGEGKRNYIGGGLALGVSF